jgi:hypothetical protein
MDWEEACKILGVSETATTEEIKTQYWYKAQLLHPDTNQDKPESVRKKAEAEFALVNRANDFLKDPKNNPLSNPPQIKIEPMRIRFKDVEIGQKKTTGFLIESVGGDYTNIWIDKQLPPWLTVVSVNSTGKEPLPLEVTIECNGVGEEGKQYSCSILVRLENEKTHLKDEAIVQVELWIKEKLEELSPDVSVNTTPAIPRPQVSQATRTEFNYGEFFGHLFGFVFISWWILYLLYNVLSASYIGIWWVLLIIYIGLALTYSIKKGINKIAVTKPATNPAPPLKHPASTNPPTPPPYPQPNSSYATGMPVSMNATSLVYHRSSCEWARKISRNNLINTTKSEALKLGGHPCQVCRP